MRGKVLACIIIIILFIILPFGYGYLGIKHNNELIESWYPTANDTLNVSFEYDFYYHGEIQIEIKNNTTSWDAYIEDFDEIVSVNDSMIHVRKYKKEENSENN